MLLPHTLTNLTPRYTSAGRHTHKGKQYKLRRTSSSFKRVAAMATKNRVSLTRVKSTLKALSVRTNIHKHHGETPHTNTLCCALDGVCSSVALSATRQHDLLAFLWVFHFRVLSCLYYICCVFGCLPRCSRGRGRQAIKSSFRAHINGHRIGVVKLVSRSYIDTPASSRGM